MSKADCRKFVPNIFNKSKCATCFKAKDEHSEEALENNRASRKVAKCGYLFVAPDWDFSNPINRTKRWQRRWFVLYDDGELTYSVDEHPETVPQAIIDMNRVVEVSEAEQVTGHSFSLALTAADRVHFLKGTSREESKWWFDVLSMFPRTNMKTGRHKRNATFPGSKATTIPAQQSTAPNSPCLGKGVAIQPFQTPPMSRPRFHSCHAEPPANKLAFDNFNLLPVKDTNGRKTAAAAAAAATAAAEKFELPADLEDSDVIPVKDVAVAKENTLPADKHVIIFDKDMEDKFKSKRVNRREIRGSRSARCNSEILTSMLIQSQQQNTNSSLTVVLPASNNKVAADRGRSTWHHLSTSSSTTRTSIAAAPAAAAPAAASVTGVASAAAAATGGHIPFYLYMADVPRNTTRPYESLDSLPASIALASATSKLACDFAVLKESSAAPQSTMTTGRPLSLQDLASRPGHFDPATDASSSTPPTAPDGAMKSLVQVMRGDPDGCGLDPVTSFCSPLPDRRAVLTSTDDLMSSNNVKKGWLLTLSFSGIWTKYWAVLKGSTLAYYRDQNSEDGGHIEDFTDLGQIVGVEETDSGRSYGFQLIGSDGKRNSLAALTSGIRTHWVQALRNASNQQRQEADKEADKLANKADAEIRDDCRELMHCFGEGRATSSTTATSSSSGGGVGGVGGGGGGDSDSDELDAALVLPPSSPPLNRTVMSRVKERDRSRSSSRSRSRHRSLSPGTPPSRDSPTAFILLDSMNNDVSRESTSQMHIRFGLADGEMVTKNLKTNLTQRLAEKDKHICSLVSTLETIQADRQSQLNDMRCQLEMKESEVKAAREEMALLRTEALDVRESLKRERSEVYKLRDVTQELKSLLESRNDTLTELQMKTDQVDSLARQLEDTQRALCETQGRLQRGIEENENLFARLRHTEDNKAADRYLGSKTSRSSTGSMPLPLHMSSKKSLPRLDSLSDLSNIDYDLDLENMDKENLVDEYVQLRLRFEKAVSEIRALKRELRGTQSTLDSVEVAHMALRQQWQAKEADYSSQLQLMAAKIEDVTSKMAFADKQARILKAKLAKSESREKRRTQSLKGRESFQLPKEIEEKLVELEQKMATVLDNRPAAEKEISVVRPRKSFEEPTKSFRMRRKSLEGGSNDSVKILLRVQQLEQQVNNKTSKKASSCHLDRKTSIQSKSAAAAAAQGKPPRSSPVKSTTTTTTTPLKRVDSSSSADSDHAIYHSAKYLNLAHDLQHCIVELELVLDAHQVDDAKDLPNKMRRIHRELSNGNKTTTTTTTPTPKSSLLADQGQCQMEKIQELLRVRLSELKFKRDQVRNMGKLDSAAVSQIAAEKLALELAMAEQLSSAIMVKQAEQREDCIRHAHWTVRKLGWLKRKLAGDKSLPALEQSTSFGTYCAALAERLSALAAIACDARAGCCHATADAAGVVDSMATALPAAIAQKLSDEERHLSVLFAKYRQEKLDELALLLAHETLRMGDAHVSCVDNQLVEEVKVRQAWLEAQDIANKELVDSEVRQAMTRMAQVFAEDAAAEERLASALLLWPAQQLQYEHRCQVVEEVLRQEMEETVLLLSNAYEKSLTEMKANGGCAAAVTPDGDLEALLSDFAEIVAHKALIDGHIAVLQGEGRTPLTASNSDSNLLQNIMVIQQTEELISPLHVDLCLSAMNCVEVAAIMHRNLIEPKCCKPEDCSVYQEDMTRQKYQDEIEQLRALTEKAMSAMETSHKRIIEDLEEKHRQDLARLQVDKERALAEETQATLAALDAMRKAHEAEVQREISRFKEQFLHQVSNRQGSTVQHEKEMQEIRREILSLSEKYSHKCLETAALEQKISSLSQQGSATQRQIHDLDSRNQQLRDYLECGIQQKLESTSCTGDDLLKAKDAQLLMLHEDVAELQYCLRESQSREEELTTLARQLGQCLRTERPLRPDEISALRHRLDESLFLVSAPATPANNAAANQRHSSYSSEDRKTDSPPREVSRFHYVRSKDLTRSPSCPRLSSFLSLTPRLRPALRESAPGASSSTQL